MKRYFIIGTDTDCGKTYVTGKLLSFFSNSAAIKPVASGCMELDGQLVNADAHYLQQYTDLSLDIINPWRFKSAVSPHLSAKEMGLHLNITELADYCQNLHLPNINKLFIEGAGGLMVPLNDHETWVNFLTLTKIPVILVVGLKLGCLNHALLTEAVLKAHHIRCLGWIANSIDPDMLMPEENVETLINLLTIPLLGKVAYKGNFQGLQTSSTITDLLTND